MSYTHQRRPRRQFLPPEPLPDPLDGSLPDAKFAREQGYGGTISHDLDGKIDSAIGPTGERIAFVGGKSPEQAASEQLRANLTRGASQSQPKAGGSGDVLKDLVHRSTASLALAKAPTAAAALANAPTAADRLNSAPTAADTLAKAPTAADALNKAPTAADTLRNAPTAAAALAKAPTANDRIVADTGLGFGESAPGTARGALLGFPRQPAPAAAPAAPASAAVPAQGPRDFRSFGSQPVVIAGSAADSAAAVGQIGRLFNGFNQPVGRVGKIGQVAAAGDPYADVASHLGTTAVPGAGGKPGFVTTGAVNPNGPGDGGTGISVGGVAQVKRPDGMFAAATPTTPVVPPLLAPRNSLAATGTYGDALKSMDAGPVIRAPLAPVTSTPAAAPTLGPSSEPELGELTQRWSRAVQTNGASDQPAPFQAPKIVGQDPASDKQGQTALKGLQDTYAGVPDALKGAGSDAPRTILGAVRQPAPITATTPPVPLTTLPAISPVPSPRALTLGQDPAEIERRRKAASGALAAAF